MSANFLFSLFQLADGLILDKISCPLGVLLIIFESRPDALVQVRNQISLIHNIQYSFLLIILGCVQLERME